MKLIRNLIPPTSVLLFSLLPISSSAATDPNALLGSSRGGSAQWDYCYGKADAAVLPQDPRSLVQPGTNVGKAVVFNTFWKDCHLDPALVDEEASPKNCGELRDRFNRGNAVLDTGGPGVAALFAGNDPNSYLSAFGISTFTAAQYNEVWRIWGGFLFRPANFDQLVAERYGSGFGTTRNPYPKPGEDPNRTNGGSGQLPEIFTQLRNSDGSWSGRIGVTCHACHSGVVGTATDGAGLGTTYGSGSSLADMDLLLRDMLPLGYPASLATFANLSRHRGTNNASDVNLAFLFPDKGLYTLFPYTTLFRLSEERRVGKECIRHAAIIADKLTRVTAALGGAHPCPLRAGTSRGSARRLRRSPACAPGAAGAGCDQSRPDRRTRW